MRRSVWAAVLQIASMILSTLGSVMLVPLYKYSDPQEIGALTSIFGAIIFSLLMMVRRRERITPKPNRGKLRPHWPIIAIMLLAGMPTGQVNQMALNGAGVGVLTAVTTAGMLALTTWRLISAEGRGRAWHAVWPMIGLGGIILLAQPFSGAGPSAGGMAAAVLLSGLDIALVVTSKKLAELDVLTQSTAIMRWLTVAVVALPILLSGDHRWMTGQVLTVTAASTLLMTLSNWVGIPAAKLAPSDGLIASVSAAGPVLAALIALIVGQEAPGLWGWLGAGLVVVASVIASWMLDRAKRHPVDPRNTQ